jgi:hypothetical protein
MLNASAQKEKNISNLKFKKFKTDVSFGYAKPQLSSSGGGALFAIEPKYAVIDQLSIGLRIEAAVTAKIDKTGNGSSAKANASYLLTGDYYFNNHKFRPFGGGGAGIFTTASVDQNTVITSSGTLPMASKFGFMVRAGFEYGHLRVGVESNFLADKAGYLGFKLGVCFGGGRK